MLARKTPTALATNLTIKGQGVTEQFDVTFNYRTEKEIQDNFAAAAQHDKAKDDLQYVNRQGVLYITKEWDAEYPLTDEGLTEAERDRPGLIEAMFYGYHRAWRVELAKN